MTPFGPKRTRQQRGQARSSEITPYGSNTCWTSKLRTTAIELKRLVIPISNTRKDWARNVLVTNKN